MEELDEMRILVKDINEKINKLLEKYGTKKLRTCPECKGGGYSLLARGKQHCQACKGKGLI